MVRQVGHLEKAYVINDFAQGKPGNIMDLVLVGTKLDKAFLNRLVRKAESTVSFAIRLVTVEPDKLEAYVNANVHALLIWSDTVKTDTSDRKVVDTYTTATH